MNTEEIKNKENLDILRHLIKEKINEYNNFNSSDQWELIKKDVEEKNKRNKQNC